MPHGDLATRSRTDHVAMAAAGLVLEIGTRQLRTADIAERAGVNESTLFRKFGNLDEILELAFEWSWAEVVRAVSRATFADLPTDPRQQLLADTSAILHMRADDTARTAATFAFLMLRRGVELKLKRTPESLHLAQARLEGICERLTSDAESANAPRLATLVMNYLATVFLTWQTMPEHSDDITDRHDLTIDEAQLGILLLIDREYANLGQMRSSDDN